MKLLPEYSSLFEKFNDHGVPFCLLRDENKELQEGKLLKDLDILVADDRFTYALQLLQEMGYRIKNTELLNPYKVVLIKYLNGRFIVLDLHRRLVYEGLVYLDYQSVLQRRERIGNYFKPSDTDLLFILIFHNILGKSEIQDKHYGQIKKLINQMNSEYAETVLKEYGTDKIFFQIIDTIDILKKDRSRLLKVRRSIIRSIYKKKWSSYFRVIWLKCKKFFYYRLLFKRHGILIACLGVDGAGKSSMAEALCSAFNQHMCFNASVHYMGPWGHYHLKILNQHPYIPKYFLTTDELINRLISRNSTENLRLSNVLAITLKQMFGKKITEDEKRLHKLIREQSKFYLLLRYIRSLASTTFFFILITIEMYLRYFKIYRRLHNGQIVITDRYIYDLMVGSMHQVAQANKNIRKFLCKVFFKPDIVFLLCNTPEQILARKKDLTAENLNAIQVIYNQLAAKYHFINIWTNNEQRILAQQAIEAHFDKIINTIKI